MTQSTAAGEFPSGPAVLSCVDIIAVADESLTDLAQCLTSKCFGSRSTGFLRHPPLGESDRQQSRCILILFVLLTCHDFSDVAPLVGLESTARSLE